MKMISGAFLAIVALAPAHAQATGALRCGLSALGGVVIGSISMAVDAGFTINAIVKGAQAPGYPDATAAAWQIGLMVPQILVTSGGVISQATECKSTPALVVEAIPLAWSVGLLGHGIWAFSAAKSSSPPQPQPASLVSSAVLIPRFMAVPAVLDSRSVGLRVYGRF